MTRESPDLTIIKLHFNFNPTIIKPHFNFSPPRPYLYISPCYWYVMTTDDNPMRVNIRSDGRREWICEHGIGHTVGVPEGKKNDEEWWVHGCDGCCKGVVV